MSKLPSADSELETVAIEWLVKFDAVDDPEKIWWKFRKWIDESPAHLEAFLIAEGFWNIAQAGARALAPTAGEKENQEFRETVYAELKVCPHLFGK
jgi:ferric-dicitrate binding protein FerR (iron transport regulator)